MKNIFLIGFMGTGKSTIASCLEKTYGMNIVEMDETIAMQQKRSIPDIFEKYGEEHFRNLETELLIEIQKKKNQVVSCGGGVPMRAVNVAEMKKNGCVVLLTATPETILERVKEDDNRPLLRGNKNVKFISELLEKRREKYEVAADIVVATDGKDAKEICEEIFEKIGEAVC